MYYTVYILTLERTMVDYQTGNHGVGHKRN